LTLIALQTPYYDPSLRQEIECLGPIRHIIAPNSAHWSFVEDWKERVPDALVWAAPGLRQRRQVKKACIAWHGDLGAKSQAHFAPDLDQIEVPGIGGFSEFCFYHRKSGSVVVTDLIQNLDDHRQSSMMRLFSNSYRCPGPRTNLFEGCRAIEGRTGQESSSATCGAGAKAGDIQPWSIF
jgi:hypothetical protein